MEELTRYGAASWIAARSANDFARMQSYLETTLDLSRQLSAFFPGACGACLRHPLQFHVAHIHLRDPSILVIEAAEYWEGDDGARGPHRLASPIRRFGDALADALVRPGVIEVLHVHAEHATQMGFAHDQQVIEAFTPHAAQQSFADRVLLTRQPHPVRRMERNSSR